MEKSGKGTWQNKDRYVNPRPQKTAAELKTDFEKVVSTYLENRPYLPRQDKKVSELEIRFGTNNKAVRALTKIDYDNVIKQLYACGFKPEIESGLQILRIQSQYIDKQSGQTRMSNIRAEVVGTDLIREYCRTNNLRKVIDLPSTVFNKIKFTQKSNAQDSNNSTVQKVDLDDFGFRVSYQMEQDYNIQSPIAKKLLDGWTDSKKCFVV
jgi:hypothetical protein